MRSLLVVDDEVLMAEGMRAVLSAAFEGRLRVLSCYSAREALQIAAEAPVDVLLTDINMPDCTGLQLHDALRVYRPECLVIYLTGYSEFEYARQALDQRAFAYILKGEGDERVVATVERALRSLDGAEALPEDGVAEGASPEPGDAPDWIRELHAFILANLAEDLSLNRLADFCHFHPVYLSRTYKEATGETLSDYINRVREEKAAQLLRMSDYSVGDIARITGFATDNYFCRWFKKRTGKSPARVQEHEQELRKRATAMLRLARKAYFRAARHFGCCLAPHLYLHFPPI